MTNNDDNINDNGVGKYSPTSGLGTGNNQEAKNANRFAGDVDPLSYVGNEGPNEDNQLDEENQFSQNVADDLTPDPMDEDAMDVLATDDETTGTVAGGNDSGNFVGVGGADVKGNSGFVRPGTAIDEDSEVIVEDPEDEGKLPKRISPTTPHEADDSSSGAGNTVDTDDPTVP